MPEMWEVYNEVQNENISLRDNIADILKENATLRAEVERLKKENANQFKSMKSSSLAIGYARQFEDEIIAENVALKEQLQKIADFYKTPGLEKAQNAMAYDMRKMALEALGKEV